MSKRKTLNALEAIDILAPYSPFDSVTRHNYHALLTNLAGMCQASKHHRKKGLKEARVVLYKIIELLASEYYPDTGRRKYGYGRRKK